MHAPVLTLDEQSNIETGSWFSKLSPALRQAILERALVRRVADGAILSARGAPAEDPAAPGRGDKIVEVADALEISYKTVANTTSLLKQKLGQQLFGPDPDRGGDGARLSARREPFNH